MSGELVWAVKESFVAYVEAVGGTVEPSGGAVREGALFRFPEQDAPGAAGERCFGGEVRFRAHDGLLAVTLSGLRLVDGVLRCRRPHRDELLDLVTLEPVGSGVHRTTLAAEGAALFGGQYDPGQPMADLTLTRG